MEREKLKELIQEQVKLVALELNATGQGYAQALGWVIQILEKEPKTETVNSGPTTVINQ